MTIKAVLRHGVIEPVEPLPTGWVEGQELVVEVAKQRERHKATFQSNYGFSLTYLPFITRAAVIALREFPLLNASLDWGNLILKKGVIRP